MNIQIKIKSFNNFIMHTCKPVQVKCIKEYSASNHVKVNLTSLDFDDHRSFLIIYDPKAFMFCPNSKKNIMISRIKLKKDYF